MTPEEREQVVELLRCAADADLLHPAGRHETFGLVCASFHLGHCDESTFAAHHVADLAMAAWHAACRDLGIKWPHRTTTDAYRQELLEAAARVEEGSWP